MGVDTSNATGVESATPNEADVALRVSYPRTVSVFLGAVQVLLLRTPKAQRRESRVPLVFACCHDPVAGFA